MILPRTDTHIHATRYRAIKPMMEVTVAAVLERCVSEGIEYAGVVEHLGGPTHPLACLLDLTAEFDQITPPIPAVMGMELDIQDADGNLSGTQADRDRAHLDFVLAGAHGLSSHITSVQAFIEYHHRAQMAAITRHPWIDVIVHPWTPRRRLERAGIACDWCFSLIPEPMLVEWADALAAHRKAVEINTKAILDFEDSAYQRFIDILIERKVSIAVGSDAHKLQSIGASAPIYDFLEAKNVPPELIWFPKL